MRTMALFWEYIYSLFGCQNNVAKQEEVKLLIKCLEWVFFLILIRILRDK